MTTVAQKVDTFETALEPVRQLNIPMGNFLQAHPELAKPIQELRLREILAKAKNKYDLPKLWLIWRAYNHLNKNNKFDKELQVIKWKIEEIVLQELDLPENDTLETIRELRFATPTGGEAMTRADTKFIEKLEPLVDKNKGIDQLAETRRGIPSGYDQHKAIGLILREKALEEIKKAKVPGVVFALIDRDDLELTNADKRQGLNHAASLTKHISVLKEVVTRLEKIEDPSRFHEKSINAKILSLCKTKDEVWQMIETADLGWHDRREGVIRILRDFGPVDIEDLEKAMIWGGGDNESHKYSTDYTNDDEFINLKVANCLKMAEVTTNPTVARKLYGWFKDINYEKDLRFSIKVAAIRTLYRLHVIESRKGL
jgi:hypothetical protein